MPVLHETRSMKSAVTPAVTLAERLCRPRRIGVFGHRGAGKTTLLTMLYREAVGGRIPDLRLAAADARTADYLSDKVLQLESGLPLPATLGETELRYHLYYRDCRLDLLFKDYQGEHVALGREEPIRDFLRDCDAVWLCLDVPIVETPAGCLQAQQEVEQIVEDYLTDETPGMPPRPMALVLTKADLIQQGSSKCDIIERYLGMTRHTLQLHCPGHGLMAVSSLGPRRADGREGNRPFDPQPIDLAEPLIWLAETLQSLDEARLNFLWDLPDASLPLLQRCVAAYVRRYPGTPAALGFQRRLRQCRQQRRRRRGLVGALLVASVTLVLWTYDVWGEHRAARFAVENADQPLAVKENWLSFQRWHPSRHWLRPASARAERIRMRELDDRVRGQQYDERLAELRRRATDPDADAETLWRDLQSFHRDFPERDIDEEWQQFRNALKRRADSERERRAEVSFAELDRTNDRIDLKMRIERADRFLRDYAGTARESEVRRRRASYGLRLEESDIEAARAYSASHPLNFQTRREHYQRYLEGHPDGAFASEASVALKNIDADWDKHDFRAVRDRFQEQPGDVKELQLLCRSYLAVHAEGRFRDAARDLLRWTERVTQPGEYRIVLKSGDFDRKAAHLISRGLSLSVEIEVNGVRHGPSNIVARSYQPEWNYEFPRRVRWKLGDSVRIIVTDNYYWDRKVAEIASEENDSLAIRLLDGELHSGKNTLTFESDFKMPVLPKIE